MPTIEGGRTCGHNECLGEVPGELKFRRSGVITCNYVGYYVIVPFELVFCSCVGGTVSV